MGVTASVKVDGNNIPTISFLQDFVGGTIIGMIETFQDVKPTWSQINLSVDRQVGVHTTIRIDEESISVDEYANNMVTKILLSLLGGLRGVPENWAVTEFQVKRRMS
jgi:hypothetical protein